MCDSDGAAAQRLSSLLLDDVACVMTHELPGLLPHASALVCLASSLLCIREVGIAGLTALPALALLFAACYAVSRQRWDAVGDAVRARVSVLAELLEHFHTVRLLNLTDVFARRIAALRTTELDELALPLVTRAVCSALVLAVPGIVNAVVVSVHRLGGEGVGGGGTGVSVFATLILLSSAQLPLAMMLFSLPMDEERGEALQRILALIQGEERPAGPQVVSQYM